MLSAIKVVLTFLFVSMSASYALAYPLSYYVKPVILSDRTDLDILVVVSDVKTESVSIRLPRDNFGFPKLERFVTSFSGIDGTSIEKGATDERRTVRPNRSGEIRLKYSLSFDPRLLSDYTYGPNTSSAHFHATGGQWSLTIGGDEDKHDIRFEMVDIPKGWSTYTSLSADPLKFQTIASFDDLIQTAIGGGKPRPASFRLKGKPVSVFVQGKFAIPNSEIVAAVRKIVKIQREEFQDNSQPFYNVVILPKDPNVAGVRFKNMFISFFKADITRPQMYGLLAHEMAHNWFTADIIKPDAGEMGFRYAWFYEGVNDYFARRILWRAGLLTTEQFVELVNRDVINVADNPNRSTTYAQLEDAARNGRYDQAFIKLSYYRGALLGFLWDNRLRSSGKHTMTELIRDVYAEAKKTEGRISPKQLFELTEKYGIDSEEDLERYIVRGEAIHLAQAIFCDAYQLTSVAVPSFDPGFALRDSNRNKRISGVAPDGPAYKAGLRDGMELFGLQNDNRFGNAWNPDLHLSIKVRQEDQFRTIEFFPRGPSRDLQLLSKIRSGRKICPS